MTLKDKNLGARDIDRLNNKNILATSKDPCNGYIPIWQWYNLQFNKWTWYTGIKIRRMFAFEEEGELLGKGNEGTF